jgi:hypothetical protein
MIMRAMEHSLPWSQVQQMLDELSGALTGSIATVRARS